MTLPKSPTARHLAEAIENSYKSQREIAQEAGFTHANILSMMKSGDSKVPINRIPKLAAALGIAPSPFINVALHEYHPELHAVLTEQYGIGLTYNQRLMLDVLDETEQVTPVTLDGELCDLLVQLLIHAGHTQNANGMDL